MGKCVQGQKSVKECYNGSLWKTEYSPVRHLWKTFFFFFFFFFFDGGLTFYTEELNLQKNIRKNAKPFVVTTHAQNI